MAAKAWTWLAAAALCLAGCERRPSAEELGRSVDVVVGDQMLTIPLITLARFDFDSLWFELPAFFVEAAEKQALPNAPVPNRSDSLRKLNLSVMAWGSQEYMMGRELCPQLRPAWVRSICRGSEAPFGKALPRRFTFFDIASYDYRDGPMHSCAYISARPLLERETGKVELTCEAEASGSTYYMAVLRIAGDLGVTWIVWNAPGEKGQAEQMAERQAEALMSLVANGLDRRPIPR